MQPQPTTQSAFGKNGHSDSEHGLAHLGTNSPCGKGENEIGRSLIGEKPISGDDEIGDASTGDAKIGEAVIGLGLGATPLAQPLQALHLFLMMESTESLTTNCTPTTATPKQ